MTPVGRMVLDRNPDNFFAETEQVAFGVQNLVPGHRLLERPAAGRAHPLLLRHAAAAARRSELPRDSRSTRRSRRPTTTSATAFTARPSIAAASPTSPTRSAAAVRSRRAARLHELSRADRRRQGPRQAREVRRPLLAGHAVLEQPDALREGAHRPRLPLRAHQGAGARDSRAHGLDAAQRLGRARAGGGRRPRHSAARGRCRASSSRRAPKSPTSPALSLTHRPGDGSIRGRKIAILVAPGVDADSVSRTQAALAKAGAVVRLVAARLGSAATAEGGEPSSPTRPSRPCRRCSSTPWSSPMAGAPTS